MIRFPTVGNRAFPVLIGLVVESLWRVSATKSCYTLQEYAAPQAILYHRRKDTWIGTQPEQYFAAIRFTCAFETPDTAHLLTRQLGPQLPTRLASTTSCRNLQVRSAESGPLSSTAQGSACVCAVHIDYLVELEIAASG